MLVLDSSAIVAILTDEPEADAMRQKITLARACCMSSFNLFETRIVLALSRSLPEQQLVDFLQRWSVDIVPFDDHLSQVAFEAYRTYGKGRHPARLNMGDCAAYALARARGWPLLWKGEDFALTDLERA